MGHELTSAIDKHFPEEVAENSQFLDFGEADSSADVRALRSGYLQSLDLGHLVDLAADTNSRCIVRKLPGDFVFEGDVFTHVYSEQVSLLQKKLTKVRKYFTLGDQRTESQDVRYGARQLSKIASRALSPGINDPYTAMGCIDWTAAALARIANR